MSNRVPASALVTSVVLVCVLYAPLFQPGYVLVGDMVFTPDMPWKAGYLGLDGSLPRAVPTDAIVWALTTVLPGWIVQRLFLFGAVVVAVWGVDRLLAGAPTVARVAGAVAFVWAPYTHDRLGIGQWSLLVSVSLLPWVVLAARAYAAGRRPWIPLFGTILGASVMSPSGGVMAVMVAIAVIVVARGGLRRLTTTTLVGLIANLPWILPGLVAPIEPGDAGASLEAFSARPESGLGVVASLLGGGGIWKQSVAAPERGVAVVVGVSMVLALIGLAMVLMRRRSETDALLAVGSVGLGWCLFTTWAPGVMTPVVDAFAPLGLFRDSTRYLAPLVLVVALGLGRAVERAWRASDGGVRSLGVLLATAPVLLLPSLAGGLLGELRPVDYPSDWYALRDSLEAEPVTGPIVVVPFEGTYRRFAWNDDRAGLDPAPRFLPGEIILDDRVFLDGRVLPAESPLVADVVAALGSSDAADQLRRLGVGGVLVQRDQPGVPSLDDLGGTVERFGDLELMRFPHGNLTDQGGTREAIVLIGLGLLTSTCGASVLLVRRDGGYTGQRGPREGQ